MKILIVSAYALPHVGGIEVVVAQQAQSLAELGHDVVVFSSSAGASVGEQHVDGYCIIRNDAWNGLERWGVPFPIWHPTALRRLIRLVRASDVVHVHDASYQSSLVGGLLARLLHRRLLMTQHVGMVEHDNPLVRWAQLAAYGTYGRLLWSWATGITVYNPIVQRFLTVHRVPPGKVRLAYNGIDTSYFCPSDSATATATRTQYDLPLEKPLILFVGRLVPKKGVHRLIEACDPSYQIVLVGSGVEPDHPESVTCLGPVDRQELRRIYQACDIFAFPAVGEMLTLVMQEAMACGLPVVATFEPDYDVYNLDRYGIELVSTDPGTLRRTFLDVLEDGGHLRYMREYSRRLAEERFDWRRNAREMANLYSD
jgi:D-inositol-3-phosphate glycosyltransferase